MNFDIPDEQIQKLFMILLNSCAEQNEEIKRLNEKNDLLLTERENQLELVNYNAALATRLQKERNDLEAKTYQLGRDVDYWRGMYANHKEPASFIKPLYAGDDYESLNARDDINQIIGALVVDRGLYYENSCCFGNKLLAIKRV